MVDDGSIARADTDATNTTDIATHAFDHSLSNPVTYARTHANPASNSRRWSVWSEWPKSYEEGADRRENGDNDYASIDINGGLGDAECVFLGVERDNRGHRPIEHGQGKKCVPAEQIFRQRAGLVQRLPAWEVFKARLECVRWWEARASDGKGKGQGQAQGTGESTGE